MFTKTITEDPSKSTREKVLQTMLSRQRCTINELAKAVDINPISVRHHIARLEAEGLVTSEEERHGVGRPRRLYFLTEHGIDHFPSRYLKLTIRLLEQLERQHAQGDGQQFVYPDGGGYGLRIRGRSPQP